MKVGAWGPATGYEAGTSRRACPTAIGGRVAGKSLPILWCASPAYGPCLIPVRMAGPHGVRVSLEKRSVVRPALMKENPVVEGAERRGKQTAPSMFGPKDCVNECAICFI